uniref:Uncharacterized protein n=1 Tax=Branchiostoma floridae TaxID=7739 RepID=C3YGN5_BRAFL|eukprot:XP_002604534.1 hypothetical protein BRAFLDRAFT_79381 [Branchiostoma floridae]
MAANTSIMENCFVYPRAFDHNREFKIKDNDVKGCHDLRYLLEAQSKGLIVAAVVKLPGDDLPEGVYTVLLTWRADVEGPTNYPRKKKPEKKVAQEQLNVSSEVWKMVLCDCAKSKKSHSSAQSSKAGCTRLGVLFKFQPVVKTVYDPAVWSDKRLADCCKRAYEESTSMGRMFMYLGNMSFGGLRYWIKTQ